MACNQPHVLIYSISDRFGTIIAALQIILLLISNPFFSFKANRYSYLLEMNNLCFVIILLNTL